MKKTFSLLLILLFMAACATSENYVKLLDSWNGRAANDLVAQMGEPGKIYDNEQGNKIYEYLRVNPDHSILRCVTKFEVDQSGTIIGSNFKGGNCVAFSQES